MALPGVDLIEVCDGGIASVRGFFDRQAVPEQIGLQVLVLPQRAGPVTFGYGTRVETDSRAVPGAMSLTMLEVRTDEEAEWVREETRRILPEIAGRISFAPASMWPRCGQSTAEGSGTRDSPGSGRRCSSIRRARCSRR